MASVPRPMPDHYMRRAAPSLSKAPTPSPKTLPVHIALYSLILRLLLAAVFTGLIVLYISGYVRLTAANYQKVHLLRRMRTLEAQRQHLHSELVRRTDKETVERWVEANNMVRPSLPAVVVGSARPSAFMGGMRRE